MTTPSPAKILVLDDEAELRQLLQRYLGEQGFQVRTLADSSQLYKLLQRESFDALVLDLMMPNEDGLSVCRNLRAQGESLPIIMLTARGDPLDRIIGLEMGADDYIAKPFSPREVCARVRTVLRRYQKGLSGQNGAQSAQTSASSSLSLFEVRESQGLVIFCGQALSLTRYEFLLLKTLLSEPLRIFPRQLLMDLVWENALETLERTVDTHIKTLRQKLRNVNDTLNPISTHRGLGYSISVTESGAQI